jgi:DNA helicase-2/ATP-dependent DNA helicase PcrA
VARTSDRGHGTDRPRRIAPEIARELNERQLEAVQHGEGPLLVFAGAGSGKTRVLTYRAAYLVGQAGVSPEQILAVTFTNKAANEMRSRIERLVGPLARAMWMGTFHSICARILRRDGDRIGLDKHFDIFDESDQGTLMKECLRDMGAGDRFTPAMVLDAVSKAKNELISVREYARAAQTGFEKMVADAYRLYQQRLRENHALDFDDLIMFAVQLFEQCPDVLAEYQDRFRHILVDEYQDINHAQYRFIELLARAHRNLCVVGDDDQSIYGWRGADMRIILNFERDYPDAKIVKLEQNYRSTQLILEAAWEVIRRNQQRKEKRLWSQRAEGDVAACCQAQDEHQEAVYVTSKIQELMRPRGLKYSDFGVLYRIHAQSRVLEKVFVSMGMPYRIVGGLRFYDRAEIKDILAYLRAINNPYDSVSLKRILNVPPRGVGEQALSRLEAAALERDGSLWRALLDAQKLPLLPAARAALARFVDLINALRELAGRASVTEVTQAVIERSGYARWLEEDGSLKARARLDNVRELLSATQEFEAQSSQRSVEGFLEQVALLADPETIREGGDAVSLMTLHGAKGLEFECVFMVGMEEGIFPLARAIQSDNPMELEEERRLCYVGMTRAKQALHLTLASSRTIFGTTSRYPMSRFLKEIPDELVRGREGAFAVRDITWKGADAALAPEAAQILEQHMTTPPFGKGELVKHRDFGEGVVLEADDKVVKVAFRSGVKKLAIGIAPLERA